MKYFVLLVILSSNYLFSQSYKLGLDSTQGGYIIKLSEDAKHGLICEIQDQGKSNWDQSKNIISNPVNHSSNATKFTDWRLPTIEELKLIYTFKDKIGNFSPMGYWSSSEVDGENAWIYNFGDNFTESNGKYRMKYIRSVREF